MFGKTDQVIEEIEKYMDEKIAYSISKTLADHIGIYQELMEDERKLMEQTKKEIKNDLSTIPNQLKSIIDRLEEYSDIPIQIEDLFTLTRDQDKEIQILRAIIQRKDIQINKLKERN